MITPMSRDDPVRVEFFYLDLEACGRCRGADTALREAIEITRPSLEAMGLTVELHLMHVATADDARREGLVASPTVRIDGSDIQPEAHLSSCRECGDLCGCSEGVDCRVWAWDGEMHTTAPVAMLVAALLSAASRRIGAEPDSKMRSAPAGEVPDNLQRFFDAKEKPKAEACCAPGCCS